MRQLLDTHTFIWFVTGNSRINENNSLRFCAFARDFKTPPQPNLEL